jgi:hypothetical protein
MSSLLNLRRRSSHLCYIIIPFFLLLLCIINIIFKISLSNQTEINSNPTTLFNEQIPIQVDQMRLSNDPIQSNTCKRLCPYSSILTNVTVEFNASHMIRHFPNFVCPQNFRNLADWVYSWNDQFHEQMVKTTDEGKHIAPCLPHGSIIYVRQWSVTDFFDKVYPHLQNDFVLITGEGDTSTPTHLEQLEASNSKIIHWFGQNGQYDVSKSKKFTHIPIGNLL